MTVATLPRMARPKKDATTTIRVNAQFAEELEVISEYLQDTVDDGITIGSLVVEWSKPHIQKYRQKAIDHRIDKLKRMKDMH